MILVSIQSSTASAITIRFRSESDRKAFHGAFEEWKNALSGKNTGALYL